MNNLQRLMQKSANLRVKIERTAAAEERPVTREEHAQIEESLKAIGNDVSRVLNEMVDRVRQTTRGTESL